MTRRTAENRCAKVSEWPASDCAAWAVALQDPNPFEPDIGRARRWKDSTRSLVVVGYGRWIGWLEHTCQLDGASQPGARATRARLGEYLRALRGAGLGDLTIANYVQQLGNALAAMEPSGDWSHILRAAGRIREAARRVKDQRARMQAPEVLLQLGFDLMGVASADTGRNVVERATDFRDGLLIALLVYRPMRAANVAQLRIGTHLRRTANGGFVTFEAEEMKAPRPLEFAWPAALASALDEYLADYRPTLLRKHDQPGAVDALFVSTLGRPFDANRVGERVSVRTGGVFEQSVNAHLFRSIAATTIAVETPENIVDAARILHHRSLRTTRGHYIRARTLEAGRALHRSLEAERLKAKRSRAVPRSSG